MLSSPAAPTSIPANSTTATLTPNSVVQVMASPTQAQPPPTASTIDSPSTESITAAMPVSTSIVPTNTPQPRDTNTPGPVSPTPTYAVGFYKCVTDQTAGGGARKWKDCWRGIVNGYYVSVAAGIQLYVGGKGQCETNGMYRLVARSPGPNSESYENLYFVGCSELHIKEISGGVVTLEGGDTFSVPILSPVQIYNWAKGIVSCPPDPSEGSTGRTSINCWQGVVNGYSVLIRAGKEVDRTTEKQAASCSTKAFYSVEAWAPDDWQSVQTWVPQDDSWHQVYHEWFYPPRCTLRIVDSYGSKLYFRDDSSHPLSTHNISEDIAVYLPTPTSVP